MFGPSILVLYDHNDKSAPLMFDKADEFVQLGSTGKYTAPKLGFFEKFDRCDIPKYLNECEEEKASEVKKERKGDIELDDLRARST